MQRAVRNAPPSRRALTSLASNFSQPVSHSAMLPAGRIALRAASLLALLLALAGQAWAAAATTTTTLTTSSKTVNGRDVTVLSAKVTDPSTVTQGLVKFYDGKTLLGTGQIVNTGTKYTHGTANLSVQLAAGSHVVKAVFAGTDSDTSSASATKTVTVTGGTSATTISSTGTAGNYTLTAQVVGNGMIAPTGQVSFIDQTDGNVGLGSSTLGSPTLAMKFAKAASYPIYDPTYYHSPQQVVVADFNGDGILDIAEVDYSARISIHMGNGDGTFKAAAPFCTTGTPPVPCQAGSEPVSIVVGDFNSDGIPDLVVQDGSRVDVMIGNGDGTFQPEVLYGTASGNYNIVVADLNLDGTPDLAVTVSGGVSILLGNGDGTFQPHYEVALNDSSTYLTVGDFNKDGIPDLAVAGWNGSNVMILLGMGDGTFQAEKDTQIDVNPADGTLVAADFKGIGFLSDLAISGSGTLEAMVGNGDGTFKAPQELKPNGTFDEYVEGFAVADLNGDGIPDMALTWCDSDSDAGRVGVFYGKGDGTFNTKPTTLVVGEEPVWIAAGDFDGNGAMDLATANDNDDTLSVLLNGATTTATTTPVQVSVPGTGTQQVFAEYMGNTAFGTSESATIPLTGNGAAAPVISSLSPSTAMVSSGAFTLTVNGTGFASGAVVKWNGNARTTAFGSTAKLTAAILATDITAVGNYPVTVVSGGFTSSAVNFSVTAAVSTPVVSTILPSTAVAGSGAFTLTVNGTGFASGAVVKWNGNARTTAFGSAAKLTAAILATDITAVGNYPVTVVSGGVTSSAVNFSVTAAANTPVLTSISPNYATVGAAGFTLTVNGSNFVSGTAGSIVYWNTTKLATTYVSATKLTASVLAADVAAVGTFPVTVVNSGNATSNALPFTVSPPIHGPLAYGFFSGSGAAGATSGNITCSWSSPEYLCTLTGEAFYYSKYVVNVTPASTETPAIATVNSASGMIIVKMLSLSGTAIQDPFYIVVFKP